MIAGTAWLPPPAEPRLAAGDVHVWRMALVQPSEVLASLGGTLSADERDRAARFHFERDRAAYTAVRGVLRALLAGYLGGEPAVLGYRDRGKPYLLQPASDLGFNVSHSGDWALLAFTRGCEVGVDVERKRPFDDLLQLARVSFSAAELAVLRSLPVAEQSDAFFACWSRKEAFIKATGQGVSQLADFDVTVSAREPARLRRLDGVELAAAAWSMHELPAILEHAAALAVERRAIRLACWDWRPALLVR